MTSITTLPNGYYSLTGQQSGTSGNGVSSPVNLTQSLVDALQAASDPAAQGNDANAYLLNLSPAASQLLGGGGNTASQGSFALTLAQKNAITDILAKYKDAPFTQDTFDQIQNDLKAAGLDSDTLALQDKVKSFNATAVLIAALNGTDNNIGGQNITDSHTQKTKTSNYMQGIVSAWQAISSTAGS